MEEEKSEVTPFWLGTTCSDRSFEEYRDLLGFSENEFKGKSILDIGAGTTQEFTKQAAKKGIKVTTINPELNNKFYRMAPDQRSWWQLRKPKRPLSVAALGQNLPFKDESFDDITSLIAVPHYLPNDSQLIRQSFREMLRVLKPGEKAYLCFKKRDLIDQELSKLETEGISVLSEDMPGYSQRQRTILEKPLQKI
ncbi:MAG TPA: class I SAM-dependent methyltransferase [Patescibacteria group bacterium]|nr:class I SAM-dependent methyltransferase [Patescibacteria group bacterium]